MEDRFSALTNLRGDRKQAMFGVYDGHGGVKAAEFAAKNLDKNVLEEVSGKCDESEIADAKDVRGGSCCVTALRRWHDERERIETTGGYVDTFNGVWRIQGSLAVSRGIGDAHLKRWVIAEPETKMLRIDQDHEFLILASDGLWDKVSNQEAVDIARPFCVGTEMKPLLLACKKLVELSASRGSSDDISVMLIPLRQFI
ncbi:BnaA05g12330D [Brassica napus]|uniref:protein-serine/threonine phosphatase n=1 Tax=Brassica napus TaxID=3708 RepID=A0A078FF34_BRANA|nr:BnaA05g12330D [Brassica napus]